MSNRLEISAVKPESKRILKPKLRFAEFRNVDGWKNELLGNYLEDCSTRVQSDTDLPVYSSTREGLKRQDAYFDGRVLLNENEYGVVPPGCFVYRHMSDDGLFKFNINETGGDIAVSKEYPVFRTKDLSSRFLLYKLNDDPDFKQFALSQKAGGTRTRLYFERLCEWKTLLPSVSEQQKIAECLTSLDELISSHGKKLDAFKSYKKVLMQQLFPCEGEALPRFRFPGFLENWEECRLDELSDGISSGKDKIDSSGSYDLYGSTGIIGKTSSNSYEGEYILVARVGANAGSLRRASGQFGVTDNTLVISLNPASNLTFIFYYLENLNLNRLIYGSGQPLITGGQLKTLPIPLPVESEQKQIATSLSSLDELITAQRGKLEALKVHKKALMQQLFPSAQEAEA